MQNISSSEMPDPKVMDYVQYYKVTNLFVNDLKKVLSEIAYVDAIKFMDKISEYNNVFPVSVLNEFIRDLGNLPYKVVVNLMNVINQKDKFEKYFELIDNTQTPNTPNN